MLYAYLTVVMAVAVASCFISGWRALALPVVALEIVIGIAIGPTGIALLPSHDPAIAANMSMLSNLGLIMLMFVVATHLPVHEPGIEKLLVRSGIAVTLCFAISFGAALLVKRITGFDHVTILTLLMANSSAAVMNPIVRGKGLAGPVIVATTVWALCADAVTVILMPMALAPERLVSVCAGSTLIGTIAIICFFALKKFRQSPSGHYFREQSKKNFQALDFKQSLFILFLLSSIAYAFQVSYLVPGFAAGAVCALIGEPRRFAKQLLGLAEGLLVPHFFINLGAELNFRDVFASVPMMELAATIAIGSAIVHMAAAVCIKLPLASGLATSAQLGLPAAVASIGVHSGMIQPIEAAALVGASMLTVLICTAGTMGLARYSVPMEPEESDLKKQESHPGHDD